MSAVSGASAVLPFLSLSLPLPLPLFLCLSLLRNQGQAYVPYQAGVGAGMNLSLSLSLDGEGGSAGGGGGAGRLRVAGRCATVLRLLKGLRGLRGGSGGSGGGRMDGRLKVKVGNRAACWTGTGVEVRDYCLQVIKGQAQEMNNRRSETLSKESNPSNQYRRE